VHKIVQCLFSVLGRSCLFGMPLVAVTIFAYRLAWNGGFLWDNDDYITNNELLTAPDGWQRIWFSLDSPSQYFPLTYSAFRIEHALWGLNTTRYYWGQPSASCWQCPSGLGGTGAVKSNRLVGSCCNFCATSDAGGVSSMDHRTQEPNFFDHELQHLTRSA
jgi:hypothetical protein